MKRIALFIVTAAAATTIMSSCIPSPKPISEERRSFDRSAFAENVLRYPPSSFTFPNRAVFGGKIQLIGMEVEPKDPRPGDRITVSLYFKVLEFIDEDWELFIHGDAWGAFSDRLHGDHFPVEGRYRTGFWQKGEIIRDVFKLKIPGDYNAPKIAMWMGFYTGDTRMRVDTSDKSVQHDGQDRVNAGLIPVNLGK
ncbi:MAG: hypothetical protein WC889_12735 [Myxococcota bacterium]|jgi:hypothetical protein